MTYYGQWDPPVDKTLHESFFKDKRNGFFIEAGASDGVLESSCKFFEESLAWKGINIEPDPHLFNCLRKNRPNSINIQVALSSVAGTAMFNKAIHPSMGEHFGNGSITHNKAHLQSLRNQGCTFKTFNVTTITYRELINNLNITKVDLMVLDVEGHEESVVAGMHGCNVIPQVMCIEHGYNDHHFVTKLLEPFKYKYQFSKFNNSFFTL